MTPDEKKVEIEHYEKGLHYLSAALVKELVSALKPRGIPPDAARLFIGLAGEECFYYWIGNEDVKEYIATPEEKARLLELEKNLKGLESEHRLFHILDKETKAYWDDESPLDTLEQIQNLIDTLERVKGHYAKDKKRGRPRTRDNRLSLVRRACIDWQRATGQAATCQPSPLTPGFHETFLAVWGAITTEEMTSDALTNDIKAALKTF